MLLAMMLGFSLSGCVSQTGYLAKQGVWLLRSSTGTRSAQAMLADPATPADTRAFLQLAEEIEAYAVNVIGLRSNGNYTRYKALDRDHLVDVVQAADAVSFTPYLWTYPFLGKLPYKGFYVRTDADGEAARLRKEGWDVIIRPVDAFSTLGFTKDPLYSFMATYSPFELASVIIHEQTHATLFLKGQPDFNEELATFVGDEGAFEWMRQRYGPGSPEVHAAEDRYADQQTFVGLLQGLSKKLAAVYAEPVTREEKLSGKATLIAEFNADLVARRSTLFRTEGYRTLGPLQLNNAYLTLYNLYSGDVPLLREYWEKMSGSDLRRFMEAARELARHGDVKDQMRRQLAG